MRSQGMPALAAALTVLVALGPAATGLLGVAEPWTQTEKLHDEAPEPGDQFGATVALDGDTMVVGHPLEDDESAPVGTNVGGVTVYEWIDGAWAKVASFLGTEPLGRFGSAIALDDDTFVTNAPGKSSTGWSEGPYGQCIHSTAELYVYERVDGSWERASTLRPEAAVTHQTCLGGSHQIKSLALDGVFLVVGDPWSSSEVYIYERQPDDRWTLVDTLSWENDRKTHPFGRAVDVSADSGRVVVGHPSPDGGPAVHVYDRSGDAWVRTGTLDACCEWTGHTLAFSEDGRVIVAARTAWFESSPVHIWELTGGAWELVAQLQPQDELDAIPLVSDLALDGDVLAVGAWQDDRTPGLVPGRDHVPVGVRPGYVGIEPDGVDPCCDGATYIFRKNTTSGAWDQTAKVMPWDEFSANLFGWDVDLDAGTLVVGAPVDHGSLDDPVDYVAEASSHGAVYVFAEDDGGYGGLPTIP